MKKILILIGTFFVFITVYLIIKEYIGDLRPALLPPSPFKNQQGSIRPSSNIGIGDPMSFPLQLPDGFSIGIFAKNLGNARDLDVSPGGTLFLSIPSSGKVVALPDRNNDGRADEVKEIARGLNRPHGIAFNSNKLYIVEETRVTSYDWIEQNTQASNQAEIFSLPKGGRHFTRAIAFNKIGQMFISLGSSCDVCFEKHEWLAAIVVSDADGNNPRLFAKGLRNSVFIAVNPTTDELWGTEMGRDFLGDNLPPDEINIIFEGSNYGWPVCYGNKIHDTSFDKNTYIRNPCEDTQLPIFEIAAHSAPLGLTFINSQQFPKEWQGDLLVAYHGSLNRSTPIGYKVVRLDVDGNSVKSEEDFLAGFLDGFEARGRPVDLIFDKQGSLYISDDKAGVVYKIYKQ